MKLKLLFSFLFLALLGSSVAFAAELKPYQKEALEKLRAFHGPGLWPMVQKQYETVIGEASEEKAKSIVKMITESQGGGNNASSSDESDESDSGDAYEKAEAIREDLEAQINPKYDAFVEYIAHLGSARGKMGDEARNDIYKAEKGARLQAVSEFVTHDKFVTNQSLGEGLENTRLTREKVFAGKTFYKVNLPSGNPPDTTEAVRTIIRDASERIKELNGEFGKIAADIKKRIDAIPYGGGVDVNKALKALMDEREKHNKLLSAKVQAIVQEMNSRIADQDRKVFDWIIQPLREAQPQSGPVASR